MGQFPVKHREGVDTSREASVPYCAESHATALRGGKEAGISSVKALFDDPFHGLLKDPEAQFLRVLDTTSMFGPVFIRIHYTPTELKKDVELNPAAPLLIFASGLERKMCKERRALHKVERVSFVPPRKGLLRASNLALIPSP